MLLQFHTIQTVCQREKNLVVQFTAKPYLISCRESVEGSKRLEDESSEVEDDSASESLLFSESEDLSDIFETESEEQEEDNKDRPLYLDRLDKFPSEKNDNEPDDFEAHLRKIASLSDKTDSPSKELKVSELDEIDKIFLRASSLLKKR